MALNPQMTAYPNRRGPFRRLADYLRGSTPQQLQLAPSQARSQMAQALMQRSASMRNESGSPIESLNIIAAHVLPAILARREEAAQRQQQQRNQVLAEQLLGVPQPAQVGLMDIDTGVIEDRQVPRLLTETDKRNRVIAQILSTNPNGLSGLAGSLLQGPERDVREVNGQLVDVTAGQAPRVLFSSQQPQDIERIGQRVVAGGQESEVFRDKATNQIFIQDAQGNRQYLSSSDLTTPPQRVEQGGPGSFDLRTRSQQGADVQKFQDSAIGFTSAIQTATDLMSIAESSPESLGAPGTILRVGNEFARTAVSLGGMLGVDIGADRDLGNFDFSKFRDAAIENQAFRAGIYNIALATAVADQGGRPSDRDVQLIIDQLAGSTADPKAFARTMGGFVERLDRRIRTTARVKRIPQEIQDAAFGEFDSALQQFKSSVPSESTQRAEDLPGYNELTPDEQAELRRRLSVR